MIWTWEGGGQWYPLKAAQFPDFRAQFDAVAPEEIREFSPPFLGALQEPGLMQMWTGLVLRTRPGWSALVRAPANMPRSGTYELYEGIVETDRWFGPLITFYRFIPTARYPMRADRSAAGSLPTRAFRYCEPATSAAAFGWYVFPPISFSVQ